MATTPVFLTDKDFRSIAQDTDGGLTDGDLLNILDFCLVTTCGWTIVNSTSLTRIYKPNLSKGVLYIRDDNKDMLGSTISGSNGQDIACFVAAEDTSGSPLFTLVNQFPNSTQETIGLFMPKAQNWAFFGNDQTFYFFTYQKTLPTYFSSAYSGGVQNGEATTNIFGFMQFGDFKSKRASIYDVLVFGNNSANPSGTTYSFRLNSMNSSSPNTVMQGLYIARDDDFTTVSKNVGRFSDNPTTSIIFSLTNTGFVDKSLLLTPVRIINNNKIIGQMRGMYSSNNSNQLNAISNAKALFNNDNPSFIIGSDNYQGIGLNGSNSAFGGWVFNITDWS